MDLGYYRIMSLKEAENHDPGHGHAQQDKRGVPVSDQPEDQIEKQVKNRNLYNKPPVAVNQRDSADVQKDLPPGPVRAVYSGMKKNPQRIDQPEGNEDRRESPAQKMSEIILPAVQAANKTEAREKEKQSRKQNAQIIEDPDGSKIPAAVRTDLLGDMMKNNPDTGRRPDHTRLFRAQKSRVPAAAPREGGLIKDEQEPDQQIYGQKCIIHTYIIGSRGSSVKPSAHSPAYSFLDSQPRKMPPSKMEMITKKISAKRINTNDGIRMRVYFLPLKVPLRI